MQASNRLCLAIASLIGWANSAAGMYTPNPAGRWQPQRFFLAADLQYNSSKTLDLNRGSSDIDDMVGFFVRPGYSLAPNLMLYGRLGVQSADDVEAGVAVGVGLQGAYVFPQLRDLAIGAAFDYMHWSADFEHGGPDIDWNEYQLTPAVSYNIPSLRELTPYAGLMLDWVDARDSLSENDLVGFVGGVNFDPSEHVRLDAQFRVNSESGFLLSAGYLF